MSFPYDNSTQLGNVQSLITTYSTNITPDICFNGTSGIYNPSANTIKIFTNNTDALTIDSNQCIYGNGTGLTNIGYSNVINKPTNFQSDWNSTIINKPTNFQSDWNSTVINKPTNFQSDWNSTVINKPSNFQSDWNSTIINKPDLTIYGTNVNLNNLSTYSALNIGNLQSTSTTIFNNLNSFSTSGQLSINNLNSTMTSIFSISAAHQLSINNLQNTSTTIFNNLNSFSTSGQLNINNLNSTMTSIFSISAAHQLSINNLQNTSTTIFNNLNSFSTSAQLSINNLNSSSTTIFNKTNFNNLIVTNASTFLSTLNISGNTTLANITTCLSSLNVGGKLQVLTGTPGAPIIGTNGGTGDILILKQGTGTTYPYSIGINNTNMWYSIPSGNSHNFYINGNLVFACDSAVGTFAGNLNAGGLIYEGGQVLSSKYLGLGGGTLSGNITSLGSLNVSGTTLLSNTTTSLGSLNVSGKTLLSNKTTCLGSLNVSGTTILTNSSTCVSTLYVSGTTTLANYTIITGALNVSGAIYGTGSALTNLNYNAIFNPPIIPNFNNPCTFLSSLNVSGNTTLQGLSTFLSSLNVSGNTTLQGLSTLVSSLNVSGLATLQGVSTLVSSLNVSGLATLSNNANINGSLNISGTTNINGDKIQFPNTLNQYKINLYGTNSYGLGIAGGTLMYSSAGNHNFYNSGNNANTFSIDSGGNCSNAGNFNINGFLTCGNRWVTLSAGFGFGGGTTYCAGFYLNGYPNLINGKTFLIDGSVTNGGFPTGTSYGFTQIVNNPGATSSGNVVAKNLYMSGNTVVNWYNAFTSWNDGLNVYTYGTSLNLVCTLRIMVLG